MADFVTAAKHAVDFLKSDSAIASVRIEFMSLAGVPMSASVKLVNGLPDVYDFQKI